MNSKLVTRLWRLEQRSSLQRASFEQEMLSKAFGRLSDAELEQLINLFNPGRSNEPTLDERSAIERFQALYDQAGN